MGAHNQQWHFSGLGFHQYLPAYGIWTGKGDADKAAIVEALKARGLRPAA